MTLKDKVVIITGGSRGIGRAIAYKMIEHQAHVIINYNSENSQKLVDEIIAYAHQHQVKALGIKANVANEKQAQSIVALALKEFGHIDVLVNNAGITRDNLIMAMSEQQFSDVININLNGVFYMTKHVVKPMMKQRKGSIINIASVVGVTGNAGQINYSAAKAGVIGMTKTTAKELGSRNIRCNAIAPGFIKTDMTSKLKPIVLDKVLANTQLKKLGQPSDVANLALFLASNHSQYITGQVINVCGGMVI